MKKIFLLLVTFAGLQPSARAFCGFYVAKADAQLFNTTTQVIVARSGNHSVITMSSDFKGETRDFAMVVPVPKVLQRDDIRVVERVLFDKMDAYSGPRLVEYWDQNPCFIREDSKSISLNAVPRAASAMEKTDAVRDENTSVRIEAKYTVGEYDILILSAEESNGLERWLRANGYRIPNGASAVLEPYIKSNMKFFVVKVNLEELDKSGTQLLRPLQVKFDSPKFMLPIRLGMANAEGAQDMIVYLLTQNGRVETVNYRTVRVPTDRHIPEFIQDEFGSFYVDVYKHARRREGKDNLYLEYAWNISGDAGVKCDPCPTPPPIFSDLVDAGAGWLRQNGWNGYSGNVFFTRLHVTYDRENFPQDLVFQETPDRSNFQARYIITHAAPPPYDCPAGKDYEARLRQRQVKEVQELISLTGRTSRYREYLDKLQGMLPVKDPDPIPDPVPPVPVQKLKPPVRPEASLPVVPAPVDAFEAKEPDGAAIAPGDFLGEATEPVNKGESKAYLYLSASILVSTMLLMLRKKKS